MSDRFKPLIVWTPVVVAYATLVWAVIGPTGAALSAVSFYVGFMAHTGRVAVGNRTFQVPMIDRNRLAFNGLVLLMTWLSLSTIISFQATTDRQNNCNRQVRAALNYNQSISDELRPITAAQDAQIERRRAAIDKLVSDLIAPDQPPTAESAQKALMAYQSTVADVNAKRDKLAQQRADIIAKRSTYPDPQCGQ